MFPVFVCVFYENTLNNKVLRTISFLLKDIFIVTSHGDIRRYRGNNADTHINFWQGTDYTINHKGTQNTSNLMFL